MASSEAFPKVLKDNDVRLVAYVPDNVLTPLIAGVAADDDFMPVCAAREDEAHFEQLIDRRFDDGGPVLLAANIDDQPVTRAAARSVA